MYDDDVGDADDGGDAGGDDENDNDDDADDDNDENGPGNRNTFGIGFRNSETDTDNATTEKLEILKIRAMMILLMMVVMDDG